MTWSDSQADSVDSYAVSDSRAFQHLGGLDLEQRTALAGPYGTDRTYFLYYSRERDTDSTDTGTA